MDFRVPTLIKNKLWALQILGVLLCANALAEPVSLLSNPRDAANARANMAQEADHEIIASSYIGYPDRAGFFFLNELRNAALKGKRVVLVMDSLLNRFPKSTLSYLQAAGVEIYNYHNLNWKDPLQYLNRMHDKLFITDGNKMIVGDRNIANEYYGLKNDSFVSRDVYTEGQAAADAKNYVEELIKSGEVRKFSGPKLSPAQIQAEKLKLDRFENRYITNTLRTSHEWRSRLMQAEAVQFFHDPVAGKSAESGPYAQFIKDIDSARDSITLESPYIIMSDEIKSALERAAARKVKIRVITNSLANNDKPIVGAQWEKEREFLATLGAEIWEHPGRISKNSKKSSAFSNAMKNAREIKLRLKVHSTGETCLHAKTAVMDGKTSYVMSMNMDMRSFFLNTEVAARIEGKNFASALLSDIDASLDDLKYFKVAQDGRVWGAPQERSPSCVMKALSQVLRDQL